MKKTILKYIGVTALIMGLGWVLLGAQNQFSGGGGGGLPTGLTFGSPILTVSSATNGNGVLALSGNTSGMATLTAPAVAGTVSNPIVFSNAIAVPASGYGTGSAGGASQGMFFSGSTTTIRSAGAGTVTLSDPSGNTYSSSTINGTASPSFISIGTKFTPDTGCGTIVTSSGGATAGKFTTVGSTSCTTVITLGGLTTTNGWQCSATDITTLADAANPHMSTSNATTATIVTGTIVSGDVISFACTGY